MTPKFGERFKRLRNKRYEDWTHVVLGPIAALCVVPIAEIRPITPNHLTFVSFIAKLVSGWLLLDNEPNSDIGAVIGMFISVLFDAMDGSLARYRKAGSHFGALLDKLTDAVGLVLISSIIGYRALLVSGDRFMLFAGVFIGASFVLRAYAWWVVRSLKIDAGEKFELQQGKKPLNEMSAREQLHYYLREQYRIVLFGEADLYVWMSAGLLLGKLRVVTYVLFFAMAIWFCLLIGQRFLQARALDIAAAQKRKAQ